MKSGTNTNSPKASCKLHTEQIERLENENPLGALVNELFEQSMLGDVDMPTQRARFSLFELVMDTAIGFQLRAVTQKR